MKLHTPYFLMILNQIKKKTSLINEQGRMSNNDAKELIKQTTEYLEIAPGKKNVEKLRAELICFPAFVATDPDQSRCPRPAASPCHTGGA